MPGAMPQGAPGGRRARLFAFACLSMAAAGCLGGPEATDGPSASTGAAPILSCPDPCARPIDAGARFEPAVAVDPLDPLHLVATSIDTTPDLRTGGEGWWPLAHVSSDGGASWSTTRIPGGPSGDPRHPLSRYTAMGDPVPLFLPDGTLLLGAIADARVAGPVVPSAKTGDALVVLRSTDGGRTFPEAAVVKEGGGAAGVVGLMQDEQDKEWFALGPDGTVLLSWVRIEAATPDHPSPEERVSIVVSSSTDGGRSWSPLSTVVSGKRLQGPSPLVRDDGAWLVSYLDQSEQKAFTALSSDKGRTWDAQPLDASTRFPVLAKGRGPAGERIFLAYPASGDGPGSRQTPTLRWSDDGGATWSPPLALDAPEAEGPALPALAAAPDGAAYVTFWHPRGEGAQLRAVAFRDGRLSEPLVLDETEGSSARTGHYMGLASLPDGSVFAAWNALRGGEAAVTGARLVAG